MKRKIRNEQKTVRRKFSPQTLLLEFLSIVIGVLAALAVNEWREQRSQQKLAESALRNIRLEIEANIESLELLHQNNLATVQKMADEADSPDELKFIPGLQLRETAWETMLSTGVSSYVNYGTVLMLSEVYSLQSVYKQTGMSLTDAAMNMAAFAAATGREVDDNRFNKEFYNYFYLLVQVEQELLRSYRSALDELPAETIVTQEVPE